MSELTNETDRRTTPRRGGYLRRTIMAVLLVVAIVVGIGLADAGAISLRIKHFPLRLHHSAQGETWALVGSDRRSASLAAVAGTPLETPGARGDMVLLVHLENHRTTVVSVPRDLLVMSEPGHVGRLALAFLEGPQAFVDGLCHTLGVTVDHLVVIDMQSFAALVDAVGGITVSVDTPLRDQLSSLRILAAGRVHLDGAQALALVRSRHPQRLINGSWVSDDEVHGAEARTGWGATVFRLVSDKVNDGEANPFELHRIAWAVASGLSTDDETNIATLFDAKLSGQVRVDLPVAPLGNSLAVTPDSATYSTLIGAGMPRNCS